MNIGYETNSHNDSAFCKEYLEATWMMQSPKSGFLMVLLVAGEIGHLQIYNRKFITMALTGGTVDKVLMVIGL